MSALTPEERRRLAAARRAAWDADLAPRRSPPPPPGRRQARALRAALALALALTAGATLAWALWPLARALTFAVPSSLLDWLLPPVPSPTFP